MAEKLEELVFPVSVALLVLALVLVGFYIRQEKRLERPIASEGSDVRALNINRTYSDIDGREVTNPTIRFADGTEIVGSVIVRQLRDDTWMVKIKPDDAKKSEMTVIVDVVTESATYFDMGPSPDNPGAIRS